MIGRPAMILAAIVLLAPSCQFLEEHQKAAIGVGAGAVGGGAIGAVVGGKKGAVIGAVAGALAGGALGVYLDHKDKTAEETQRAHNYSPEQGVLIELTGVSADPGTVAPGGEVSLLATYAVMAPRPQRQLEVKETRLVALGGVTVAEATVSVVRTPGTYTSELPIMLPAGAARGTYSFTVTVETAGQSSQLTSSFTVD